MDLVTGYISAAELLLFSDFSKTARAPGLLPAAILEW